jgi:hypothetical protein
MKTFKTTKALLMLAIVVLTGTLFTSCNGDDDNAAANSLVGTWFLTAGQTELFVNGVSEGIEMETIDANNFTRITFNANSTYVVNISESFMQNGQVVIDTSTQSGTYSLTGNTLFITEAGSTDIEEVPITLTANQLIIRFEEEFTDTNNDVLRFTGSQTFTRQ